MAAVQPSGHQPRIHPVDSTQVQTSQTSSTSRSQQVLREATPRQQATTPKSWFSFAWLASLLSRFFGSSNATKAAESVTQQVSKPEPQTLHKFIENWNKELTSTPDAFVLKDAQIKNKAAELEGLIGTVKDEDKLKELKKLVDALRNISTVTRPLKPEEKQDESQRHLGLETIKGRKEDYENIFLKARKIILGY